jgi:hypothetical protein
MNLREVVCSFAVVLLLVSSCQSGSKQEKIPVNQIKNQLRLLAANFKTVKVRMGDPGNDFVNVRSLNSDGSADFIPEHCGWPPN